MSATMTVIAGLGAGFAASAAFAALSLAPRSQLWGTTLVRGARRQPPRVALTFDDGPTPGATGRILDILAAERVVATFFVIGANVERHPELLRRIENEGHLVGNHSQTHAHLGMLRGARYWRREIEQCDDAIVRVTGARPTLFRPPLGMHSPFVHIAARRCGKPLVLWSLRSMDGIRTTPERILRRVSACGPGDVILLHDGIQPNRPRRDPSATITALPRLIAMFRRRGIQMVRVDRLDV